MMRIYTVSTSIGRCQEYAYTVNSKQVCTTSTGPRGAQSSTHNASVDMASVNHSRADAALSSVTGSAQDRSGRPWSLPDTSSSTRSIGLPVSAGHITAHYMPSVALVPLNLLPKFTPPQPTRRPPGYTHNPSLNAI